MTLDLDALERAAQLARIGSERISGVRLTADELLALVRIGRASVALYEFDGDSEMLRQNLYAAIHEAGLL